MIGNRVKEYRSKSRGRVRLDAILLCRNVLRCNETQRLRTQVRLDTVLILWECLALRRNPALARSAYTSAIEA